MSKIIECICCWYDLLGYGKPFIDSSWELNTLESQRNIDRIESLYDSFSDGFSTSFCKTLSINDGVIKNRDAVYEDASSIIGMLLFIASIVWDFEGINKRDKENGFPGLRGVITYGKRFSYDSTIGCYDIATQSDISFHPREFQMNTAFSKASIIEESGSQKGIKGSFLFWDKVVFEKLKEYVEQSTYNNQFSCKEYDQGNEHIFEINDEVGWVFRCFCEINPINYDYKGIKTKIYKMNSSRTQIGTKLYG